MIFNEDYIRLEIEPIINEYKLANNWDVWIHYIKDNWKIDGYKKIFTISSIEDFWILNNNIHILSGAHDSLNNLQIYFMKEGIKPIWEDQLNRNGGCWSLKLNNIDSFTAWVNLGIYMIGNTIINESFEKLQNINGLSFSQKNNTSSIIKLWTENSKYISLDCLNKNIIDMYGYNIIYKAHLAEY
jgi:translation initiation factor 4E